MYHTDSLSSISNQFFNSQKYLKIDFHAKIYTADLYAFFMCSKLKAASAVGPMPAMPAMPVPGPVISPSAVSHVEPEVGSLLLVGIMISKLVQKCARWLLARLIRYGQDRLYLMQIVHISVNIYLVQSPNFNVFQVIVRQSHFFSCLNLKSMTFDFLSL